MKKTVWGLVLWLWTFGAAMAHDLPDFTRLVKENVPAVVNISTIYRESSTLERYHLPEGFKLPEEGPLADLLRRFLDEQAPEENSLGSGFILTTDGYILTNHHVVDEADRILVRLHNRDTYEAQVVGSDPATDIALLKVTPREPLPTVKIGDSSALEIGAWVLAIGSPFGFEASVTAGIVSAKGRSLPSENYVPYIQTDVAINPGNSGGPLFNLDGEVVGINSQIFSRSGGFMGLSFAVPIDLAMNVVRQLMEEGRVRRGYLGVLIQDLDQPLARAFGLEHPHGALVSHVLSGSPADEAGLEVGDVIVGFNGTPIRASSELPPLVGTSAVGETADLEIQREGQRVRLQVRIAELPEEPEEPMESGPVEAKPPMGDRLGLVVEALDADAREAKGLTDGVRVARVLPGPAAEAGLEAGDILVMLDGRTLRDPAHYRKLVKSLPPGEVAVLVQRPQGPLFLALEIPDGS